jgi:hypothetical protein
MFPFSSLDVCGRFPMRADRGARRTSVQITEDAVEIRRDLLKAPTTNPALQRLQQRVLSGTKASEVITSYDRMHHRHSRS